MMIFKSLIKYSILILSTLNVMAQGSYNFYSPSPLHKSVVNKVGKRAVIQTKKSRTNSRSRVPSSEVVAQALDSAGLNAFVNKMDVLDKDRFYMRVREYPISKLIKLYPKVSKDKLVEFKNIIKVADND